MSSISYHFGGKEDLYRECLREHGTNFVNLLSKILTPAHDRSDFESKLKLFVSQHIEFSSENREMVLMVTKDILLTNLAGDDTHKIFSQVPEIIQQFFQDAQKKGIIRDDVDINVLSDLIMSPGFMQVLFSDFKQSMKKKCILDGKYRETFSDQVVNILIRGIY